jgi:hypothetical protein
MELFRQAIKVISNFQYKQGGSNKSSTLLALKLI